MTRPGRRISLVQRPWADQVGEEIGAEALRQTLATMRALMDFTENYSR